MGPASILSYFDFYFIMKSFLVSTFVFLLSVYHLDAFLPASHIYPCRNQLARTSSDVVQSIILLWDTTSAKQGEETKDAKLPVTLTHNDILWKLRPPPDTPFWRRIILRLAANGIRLDAFIKGQDPPLVFCPKGGQAVLEAHYRREYD